MEENQLPAESPETQEGSNLSIDDIDNLKKLTDTKWIEIASETSNHISSTTKTTSIPSAKNPGRTTATSFSHFSRSGCPKTRLRGTGRKC